jgi:PD-(D/E)XK nuclease superfamily protein
MKLPNDSIGISDINAWRDCPRRMSFSMKRHTEEGEPPEAAIEHAYGSCIHDVFQAIEEKGLTDELAIAAAFDKWAWALEPDDLDTLKKDVATYRERDFIGVRTLAVEQEFRVPLLEHEGRTIYFRFRLDRLYQRIDNASVFIHVDYKSSKWRKTEEEVHKDTQMWAYNWGVHQFFPECATLVQHYDQLRHGSITTRKSAEQREMIAEWLREQVRAILADDSQQEDGLLKPRFNQWCPWCPIIGSCSVVDQLSDFARSEIVALTPDKDAADKVGIDGTPFEQYVEKLEDVEGAEKVLAEFKTRVRDIIKKLPTSEQNRLGFRLSGRNSDVFTPEAMRQMHELLGDEFYLLVGVTKKRLDELFSDDPRKEQVLALARREETSQQLRRTNG